jgi:site-specific recombinase XerD
MTTTITIPASPLAALMPLTPNKDEKHRIGRFIQWLHQSDQQWWNPDVAAYVAYLRGVHGLSNHSISTHLATIRAQASRLIHNNDFRASLWQLASERGLQMDAAYAFVQEHITQIMNAFHPSQAGVKDVKKQDKADSEGIRLTPEQVQQLVSAPGKTSLEGIRDTALLALMVCTGIRIAEAVNIKVDDLRQYLDGQLALRITHGKGNKQRLIPYGGMSWCLEHVQHWLEASAIKSGFVFRGFFRGGKLRPSALSTRAAEQILAKYPITASGLKIVVECHDLRRTYARRAYDAGMTPEALRDNMGHDNMKTTIGYIGTLNAAQRTPGAVFENPYGG